jgi:putative ABC transport system permease protein
MTTLRFFLFDLLDTPLTLITFIVGMVPVILGLIFLIVSPKLFRLIVKNLGRNLLRTLLTSMAIMVLVFMVTMIWTILFSLERFTRDREKNFRLIITERWSLPSMMPPTHADYLNPESPKFILGDVTDSEGKPAFRLKKITDPDGAPRMISEDFMTWSFYGGTTEPGKQTYETIIFFFVMNPDHIRTMMPELEDTDPKLIAEMKRNRKAVLVGPEKLAALNKRVGERFKLTSMNYKDIDLEVEVIGTLPAGRYGQSAIMNADYFNSALDNYKTAHKAPHPLDNRRLNLIWLRVPDKKAYGEVARRVENSPYLKNPEVKCETESSGVGAFMDPYRDLLWGVKWVLVPVILTIMALVIANAIGISVRERYQEIAVLKVLGFRPGQVLTLVLGESLLVGGLSGLLSAGLAYGFINGVLDGVPFPVAFFPKFQIPFHAFWWGLATGCTTAFVGSFLPAWRAKAIRVSEVFARVA